MLLKCNIEASVYNETALSLSEVLQNYVGLKTADIHLVQKVNDFQFDTNPDAIATCRSGKWVLTD